MLNSEQKAAVEENGHTLVIALPGSGKTELCIQKICRLLSEFPNAKIVVVTFTRASADGLKARLIRQLGGSKAAQVSVNTFHSHTIKQLSGSRQLPDIIKPGQRSAMIMRAIEIAGLKDISFEDATRAIDTVKSSIDLMPETIEQEKLFKAYQGLLDPRGLCDLQDVIRLALLGMQSNTVAPLPCQFMLVDEFQDTDDVQLEWVLAHEKHGTSITVVGDDDQSIYGWRHSLGFGGMRQFADKVGASMVTLKLNYRSHSEILNTAGKLIERNQDRIPKTLIANKGPGGQVKVIKVMEREEEVVQIADEILRGVGQWIDLGEGGKEWQVPPRSWAILARNNQLLRQLSAELKAREIAHVGGAGIKDIWQCPPLSHYLGILTCVAKNETLGIEMALAWKGLPEEAINRLHLASPKGSLKTLMKATIDTTGLAKADIATLDQIKALAAGWSSQLELGRLNMVLSAVRDWIESACKVKEKRELQYGSELLSKRLSGSLAKRLGVVTRKNDRKQENADAVMLLTMHGSKGLEFENVWIVAAEQEVIPSVAGDSPSPIEEERRLMYVAMTRAEKRLFLSYAINPSCFLVEAGLVPRG